MPTIRIDEDVYESLKKLAEPFVDTPNDVIRRLLNKKSDQKHREVPTEPESEKGKSQVEIGTYSDKPPVKFYFRVNKSFLEQSNHPITIPKEFHSTLRANGLVTGILRRRDYIEISVLNTAGKIYLGKLYFAESAGGDYYQILIPKKNAEGYCSNLCLDEMIEVSLWKDGQRPKSQLRKK